MKNATFVHESVMLTASKHLAFAKAVILQLFLRVVCFLEKNHASQEKTVAVLCFLEGAILDAFFAKTMKFRKPTLAELFQVKNLPQFSRALKIKAQVILI